MFEAALRCLHEAALDTLLSRLRTILADHSTPLDPRTLGPPNNLCVHLELFGTRSSTILVYVASEGRFRMWHADGAPCQVAYKEVPLPRAPVAVPELLDKGATTR
jgi:hypothetical protein